jgi:GNAT superfamily N-acetyltransferase
MDESLPLVPIDPAEARGVDLSEWFNPLLEHFAHETLRCGGKVRGLRERGRLAALTLFDPVENVLSIFTRQRELAEALLAARGARSAYADDRLDASAEPFGIYRSDLTAPPPAVRLRHAVRPATGADVPRVVELVGEVQGAVDRRWFDGLPGRGESGYVVEVDGRLAGAAWVTVVGPSARLHSLAVRPAFRRLGIGGDLVAVRLAWAQRQGAGEAISEIADRNAASRSVAERLGMRRVGSIYWYPPKSVPDAR